MKNIDLAIKFGSNEIIIFRKGYGIVSKCSTYIAVTEKGKSFKIKAIGKQAEKYLRAKAEDIKVYEPIVNSEIVNQKMAVALIGELLNSIILDKFLLGKINALVAIPSSLTQQQLLAIERVLNLCGIVKVEFVQNSVGVHANLDIDSHSYVMVVDIGKCITDISVLNEYNYNFGRTYFIGGNDCDKSIQTFIEDNHNLQVDEAECQALKNEVASLYENDRYKVQFVGMDENKKFVKDEIMADEVRLAITNVYDAIFKFIKDVVELLPTDIAKDIYNTGVVFVGGCSAIPGLYEYAKKNLDFPVTVSENPDDAVILGVGKLLSSDREFLKIKL